MQYITIDPDKVLEVLKYCEWVGNGNSLRPVCPVCDNRQHEHEPDCALNALLKTLKTPAPTPIMFQGNYRITIERIEP